MTQNNKNDVIINTDDNNLNSLNETLYVFKEEPIQLVSIKDGILETTAEAINILTGLKNTKLVILSINGPQNSGKSTLANNLINKKESGFKVGEKKEGIWIWGKPLELENGIKLLILDCQGINHDDKDNENNININNKLFTLSALLSTCLIYVTKGELTNNILNEFFELTDLPKKINIEEDKNNKINNNIENIKEYLPEIFLTNDCLNAEDMLFVIEKNPEHEKFYKLYEKRNYFKSDEYKKILNQIKSEMKYKVIQNI